MSVALQDIEHDVLFAESEDEVALLVGERLADALRAESTVIVIATDAHRRLFADRLRRAGLDPDAAQADATLLLLDAAQTLGRLAPGGTFDGRAFDAVVGDLVRDRMARGPVFAFGEMVALLFDAGRPEEAIDLEAAWDDLLRETSARLLCAYPGSLLDHPEHARHLASVCGLHSAVVADVDFHRAWPLAHDRSAAGTARRLTANALRARGVAEEPFYDTLSVVTELVANAVSHGAPPISLDIAIDPDVVTLRVADGGSPAAVPASTRPGRGLPLVDELADRWGTEVSGAGKVVWAELAR